MLKIRNNTIKSGYRNMNYASNYTNEKRIIINKCFDNWDIKYIIDNILKDEGYIIDFENCVYFGAEDVIYYDFDDKYSIELYGDSENEFTLYFLLDDFDFSKLWELEYLKDIYKTIIETIDMGLNKKVEEE